MKLQIYIAYLHNVIWIYVLLLNIYYLLSCLSLCKNSLQSILIPINVSLVQIPFKTMAEPLIFCVTLIVDDMPGSWSL